MQIVYLSLLAISKMHIINPYWKVILKLYVLCILLILVNCAPQLHYNYDKNNQNSNWYNFRLRYNSIYNIDQLLEEQQHTMLKSLHEYADFRLFEKPTPLASFPKLENVIEQLSQLLPLTDLPSVKDELYYKLGLAFYYKSDYYTAIEYFNLVQDNFYFDKLLLTAHAYHSIGKIEQAMLILNEVSQDSLTTSQQSRVFASKSEFFYTKNELDSTQYYLAKAVSLPFPKYYKYNWYYSLAKIYQKQDKLQEARFYYQKLEKSFFSPSNLLLSAQVELIKMAPKSPVEKIEELKKIFRSGYSTNREWLINEAIGDVYSSYDADSATNYYKRGLSFSSIIPYKYKSLHWKLVNIHLQNNQFSEAENNLEKLLNVINEEDAEYLLVKNYKTWIPLLQKLNSATKDEQKIGAKISLAEFYTSIGSTARAKKELQSLTDFPLPKNIDLLHRLSVVDANNPNLTNSLYTERLAQREKFNPTFDDLYKLFSEEKYQLLIYTCDSLLGNNDILDVDKSKIAYLKAFAIGHSNPVVNLIDSFQEVITLYNANSSVVRLVQNHLDLIHSRMEYFSERTIALEKPKQGSYATNYVKLEIGKAVPKTVDINRKYSSMPAPLLLNLEQNELYYFVIMVEDVVLNLAPSRYALGQYLRTRWSTLHLAHNLSVIDNKVQLIRVGMFANLKEVKNFEHKILDLLPEIMKVGDKKYTTFVIPKKELESLSSIPSIHDYIKTHISK